MGPLIQSAVEIPILVRIWAEDGVWNFSAFDAPIVAYGEELEEARKHFEEAVMAHMQSLRHLGKFEETATNLIALAEERSFYQDRLAPRTIVEKFTVPALRAA